MAVGGHYASRFDPNRSAAALEKPDRERRLAAEFGSRALLNAIHAYFISGGPRMIALHDQAMAEIRWRSFWRDDGKAAARALNISRSHLTSLRNGTARMTDETATRILDAARLEELELADRIEAELNRPSKLKEMG